MKELYFSGEITETSALKLIKELNDVLKEETELIKLFINTSGGDFNSSLAIYDYIKKQKVTIDTYCIGNALSGGVNIFMAGNTRYITHNSEILLHAPYKNFNGQLDKRQTEIETENSKRITSKFVKFLKANTKMQKQDIDKLIKEQYDMWIDAREAIKYGIANKII